MGKGRLFCILGKSASGKDSLYQAILKKQPIPLSTVTPYTTRPIRSGETPGVEYFFTDYEDFRKLKNENRIIEYRCYHTMHGDWYYFTADDGQITDDKDYLIPMVLGGYESLRNYFGPERVIPLYIEVEDGLRLARALERERKQVNPKYTEMCRRFIADNEDFCEENIRRLEITKRFENVDFDTCLSELCEELKRFS